MKERLLEFLRNENKSSAQLADEIGVQASGISHILSGRNNPSLDFILKMLEKYPFLSNDWLLFGKGSMYKDSKMQTLFDHLPENERGINEIQTKMEFERPVAEIQENVKKTTDLPGILNRGSSEVIKIVWFYDNNTFTEYNPR